MSTLPQQSTIRQYLADGLTTTYVYNYLIPTTDDITVYVTPSGQAANPTADYIAPSEYSVTGVGTVDGGTVIFNTAPEIGSIVTLARNMQISITTQFADAQNFNGANLDAAFQRVVLLLQQLQGVIYSASNVNGSISRCLQYVVDTYLPNVTQTILPILTEIDNQVWISQGGRITAAVIEENPDSSTLRSQLESQTAGADGTTIVGYYDENSLSGSTLNKYLNTSNIYGVDAGAVNALEFNVDVSSSFDTYKKGMIVRVLIANTNTGAATINISSVGLKDIKRQSSVALSPGDLIAGQVAILQYDGTRFLLLNPQAVTYYGLDTSVSANTITVSVSPPIASYTTGFPVLLVKLANTNTGATTIAVNGLAAKAVKLPDGSALIGNELLSGMIAEFAYDGTNMQLLNPARIFANNTQALGGTDNTHPVTSLALASALNLVPGIVGGVYKGTMTFPGGLIMKYGLSQTINLAAHETCTFEHAFPSGAICGVVCQKSTDSVAGTSWSAVVTVNDITIYNLVGGGGPNVPYYWIALGF